MDINTSEAFFVFDLDDTLYNEADYRKSGIASVADCLNSITGRKVDFLIDGVISNEDGDFLGEICRRLDLPENLKEALLWQYRLHTPRISLAKEVKDLLDFLQEFSSGVSIVTDGRIISQRKKLIALGINHIPSYISEEFGAVKPDPTRFELIERLNPRCRFVYIGDNPQKDFITPKKMGWITFGLLDNGHNIHSQEVRNVSEQYLPHIWLRKLEDLRDHLH